MRDLTAADLFPNLRNAAAEDLRSLPLALRIWLRAGPDGTTVADCRRIVEQGRLPGDECARAAYDVILGRWS